MTPHQPIAARSEGSTSPFPAQGSSHLLPAYAELMALSNYSFRIGASHPEELVERAYTIGYAALALTDECSLAGVVRAHVRARQLGMPLILGTQCRIDPAMPQEGPLLESCDRLVVLAMEGRGYAAISQAVTRARARAAKGSYRWTSEEWSGGLPGCMAIWVPAPHADRLYPREESSPSCPARLWDLHEAFGERLRIGAVLHARGWDQDWIRRLRAWSAAGGIPITACGDVRFHRRSRRPLGDVLAAINQGLTVSALGTRIASNAEAHLRSRLLLAQRYPADFLHESVAVAEQCVFSLESLRYQYPREIVPDHHTPGSYLRQLCEEGMAIRYPHSVPDAVRRQVAHELALIEELHYEAYFLTVADIVHFARSQGILCQGRGSAANSAVCYVLGITEVDPSRMSVLFERFISRERREPPDIDVDFEHQRREEVVQYLYRKYGRERAALAAAVSTWRLRSALREVGKALGFQPTDIDRCVRAHRGLSREQPRTEAFCEAGLNPESLGVAKWMDLAAQLIGFPRHLSQHSGGFVIARDRLDAMVPIENAAMPGRSVIQWDKDDLEALGLLKVDVLALGMLSAIRRALDLISARDGRRFRIQDIPAEDPLTYTMISEGDTVGVFQIESRAQMAMLPRLQPRCFYDLVIEVAIVRPGPIQGGMVHPYLRRRQGLEPVVYPREEIRPALERTLGVPIFQEQVMQIAMLAAGFSAGEADQLRRAMAAWKRRGGLEQFEERVVQGMLARGYERGFADQIFQQIKGFGEYGFPESHAASFALLVYVSCWIKRHEPAAFLAAMLNSQPLGFYAPAQLIRDAREHGVEVLPVNVCSSDWDCLLAEGTEGTQAVRLGLRMVRGLSETAGRRIETWRRQTASMRLENLASAAALGQSDLQALADADALIDLSGHRRASLWSVSGWQNQHGLLEATRETPLDKAPTTLAAPGEALSIAADLRSIGVSMRRHPMALLRETLQRYRIKTAVELRTLSDGALARGSGLVTHRQRPETARGVIFVTLEDETGTIQVVIFPQLAERFRQAVFNAQLMTVYGRWQRDASTQGRVTHLLAMRVEDHSPHLHVFDAEWISRSRDFR
jgi:error-prone DNA polymerase